VSAEVNVPDEAVPTADDTRRALEALGFQRGIDRIDLTRRALDAYSVVWVPSRKEQRHHEQGILEAVVAAAPLIVAADLEREAEGLRAEAKRLLANLDSVPDEVAFALGSANGALSKQAMRMETRAAELRGESR
jgi:hypothetical protein